MAAPVTTESARDGFAHKPSTAAGVHRTLVVVDPPMEGRDVANLQRATKARLKARGLADDVPVPVHGKFTLATALACLEAQYFLGLRSDTYLREDEHGHRVVTEGAQRIIRRPETRKAIQLERAKERLGQLEIGPRYYALLGAESGLTGKGVADALAFATSKIGVTEHPLGSNSGKEIDVWCHAAGYKSPVPWCGCFVNACLMAGGLPSGAAWGIGYTPSILARAKNGTAGWSFHMKGMPGDLALFDNGAGGDPVVHVEIVRERLSATRYETIGGNTSNMVSLHKESSTMGSFRIVGFARPPYKA